MKVVIAKVVEHPTVKEYPSLKKVADLLTASRLVVALVVLVAAFGPAPDRSIAWVVPLVLLAWTGDLFDGWLARRSGQPGSTWIGKCDLPIDAALASATLVYLTRIGWLGLSVLVLYLIVALFLALLLRTHWVLNGYNTGSHLLALGSVLQILPGLNHVILASLTILAVLGRRRLGQILTEMGEFVLQQPRRRTPSGDD